MSHGHPPPGPPNAMGGLMNQPTVPYSQVQAWADRCRALEATIAAMPKASDVQVARAEAAEARARAAEAKWAADRATIDAITKECDALRVEVEEYRRERDAALAKAAEHESYATHAASARNRAEAQAAAVAKDAEMRGTRYAALVDEYEAQLRALQAKSSPGADEPLLIEAPVEAAPATPTDDGPVIDVTPAPDSPAGGPCVHLV